MLKDKPWREDSKEQERGDEGEEARDQGKAHDMGGGGVKNRRGGQTEGGVCVCVGEGG